MSDEDIKLRAQKIMDQLPFVRWDRFCFVGKSFKAGFTCYGWIDRAKDAYKDFVEIYFLPDGEVEYMTSSAKHSLVIFRILYGNGRGHRKCKRIEHFFDVHNPIKLAHA